MDTPDIAKACIVGGGIAPLFPAVLRIRDAGFCGANIRILAIGPRSSKSTSQRDDKPEGEKAWNGLRQTGFGS